MWGLSLLSMVQGGVQDWVVLVHHRLKGLDGPRTSRCSGRTSATPSSEPWSYQSQYERCDGVHLEAVQGFSRLPSEYFQCVRVVIVDHLRLRPAGSVEVDVCICALTARCACRSQVQVLGRGVVPGDAEVSRLHASHRGGGGDVLRGTSCA